MKNIRNLEKFMHIQTKFFYQLFKLITKMILIVNFYTVIIQHIEEKVYNQQVLDKENKLIIIIIILLNQLLKVKAEII